MKKILKADSQRNYLLFVMGINTGLRISDLLKLTLDDVLDSKNRPVKILILKEQKTGKARKIVLNEGVRKALQETISLKEDVQVDEYLFKSQKGKNRPISRVQAWQVLNDAAKTCGIQSRVGTIHYAKPLVIMPISRVSILLYCSIYLTMQRHQLR